MIDETLVDLTDKQKLFRLKKYLPALEEDVLTGISLLSQVYNELRSLGIKYSDTNLIKTCNVNNENIFKIGNVLQNSKPVKIDREIFGDFSNVEMRDNVINTALRNRKSRFK